MLRIRPKRVCSPGLGQANPCPDSNFPRRIDWDTQGNWTPTCTGKQDAVINQWPNPTCYDCGEMIGATPRVRFGNSYVASGMNLSKTSSSPPGGGGGGGGNPGGGGGGNVQGGYELPGWPFPGQVSSGGGRVAPGCPTDYPYDKTAQDPSRVCNSNQDVHYYGPRTNCFKCVDKAAPPTGTTSTCPPGKSPSKATSPCRELAKEDPPGSGCYSCPTCDPGFGFNFDCQPYVTDGNNCRACVSQPTGTCPPYPPGFVPMKVSGQKVSCPGAQVQVDPASGCVRCSNSAYAPGTACPAGYSMAQAGQRYIQCDPNQMIIYADYNLRQCQKCVNCPPGYSRPEYAVEPCAPGEVKVTNVAGCVGCAPAQNCFRPGDEPVPCNMPGFQLANRGQYVCCVPWQNPSQPVAPAVQLGPGGQVAPLPPPQMLAPPPAGFLGLSRNTLVLGGVGAAALVLYMMFKK